jgi:hypothetical protein
MDNAEIGEAPEIPDIDGQQPANTMHVHARRQSCVMDLHALDVMRYQKRPPALVDLPAIRQELEILFDYTGKAIRIGDAQTEAVLVERPG